MRMCFGFAVVALVCGCSERPRSGDDDDSAGDSGGGDGGSSAQVGGTGGDGGAGGDAGAGGAGGEWTPPKASELLLLAGDGADAQVLIGSFAPATGWSVEVIDQSVGSVCGAGVLPNGDAVALLTDAGNDAFDLALCFDPCCMDNPCCADPTLPECQSHAPRQRHATRVNGSWSAFELVDQDQVTSSACAASTDAASVQLFTYQATTIEHRAFDGASWSAPQLSPPHTMPATLSPRLIVELPGETVHAHTTSLYDASQVVSRINGQWSAPVDIDGGLVTMTALDVPGGPEILGVGYSRGHQLAVVARSAGVWQQPQLLSGTYVLPFWGVHIVAVPGVGAVLVYLDQNTGWTWRRYDPDAIDPWGPALPIGFAIPTYPSSDPILVTPGVVDSDAELLSLDPNGLTHLRLVGGAWTSLGLVPDIAPGDVGDWSLAVVP